MAPSNAWGSVFLKPAKNCFNAVKTCLINTVKTCFSALKLCVTELSGIYLGLLLLQFTPWLFLKCIPVLLFVKGLALNVALPLADIATDLAFTYSMYKGMNLTLSVYMASDDYKNDTCFDFTTNATLTPSNRSFLWVDLSLPNQKTIYPPSDSNITCIESRSGLEYTPLTSYTDACFYFFLFSGNNALFYYKDWLCYSDNFIRLIFDINQCTLVQRWSKSSTAKKFKNRKKNLCCRIF